MRTRGPIVVGDPRVLFRWLIGLLVVGLCMGCVMTAAVLQTNVIGWLERLKQYAIVVKHSNGRWPAHIPHPRHDATGICGWKGQKTSVCDPDGVLSIMERLSIDAVISSKAEHHSGVQVMVLIVGRINKGYHLRADRHTRAAHFARDIHEAWNMGDAVLLFMSVHERQDYVFAGDEPKWNVSDDQLFERMNPHMRTEEYGLAIVEGLFALRALLGPKLKEERKSLQDGLIRALCKLAQYVRNTLWHLLAVAIYAVGASLVRFSLVNNEVEDEKGHEPGDKPREDDTAPCSDKEDGHLRVASAGDLAAVQSQSVK